jgi:hypothetical protein
LDGLCRARRRGRKSGRPGACARIEEFGPAQAAPATQEQHRQHDADAQEHKPADQEQRRDLAAAQQAAQATHDLPDRKLPAAQRA